MAEFNTLIKSSKIQTAYFERNATLDEISQNILSIKALDQENPKSRTFSRLESNANKSLEELKLANRKLTLLLMNANSNYSNDESYKTDQKRVREQEFLLFDEIDKYTQLLHSKSIPYPPDVKPEISSGDLAASLNNLVESQNKQINNLVESQNNLVESQNKKFDNLVVSQNKQINDIVESHNKQFKDLVESQNTIMTTIDKNLTAVVTSQDKNVAELNKSLVDQIKS